MALSTAAYLLQLPKNLHFAKVQELSLISSEMFSTSRISAVSKK